MSTTHYNFTTISNEANIDIASDVNTPLEQVDAQIYLTDTKAEGAAASATTANQTAQAAVTTATQAQTSASSALSIATSAGAKADAASAAVSGKAEQADMIQVQNAITSLQNLLVLGTYTSSTTTPAGFDDFRCAIVQNENGSVWKFGGVFGVPSGTTFTREAINGLLESYGVKTGLQIKNYSGSACICNYAGAMQLNLAGDAPEIYTQAYAVDSTGNIYIFLGGTSSYTPSNSKYANATFYPTIQFANEARA